MYKRNYMQATQMADRIASGEMEAQRASARKQQQAGIMARLGERKYEESQTESPLGLATDYITLLRERLKSEEPPLEEGIDTRALSEEKNPSGQLRPVSRGDAGFEPLVGTSLDDLGAAREAVAAVESRGSGDYKAVGSVVEKGMYKGQRAYGRYQVMEGNIGPWTEKHLGQRMTKEEFLNNPEAQDRVVEAELQNSYEKFGSFEDAASVWFSGQPFQKAKGRSDGFTTVPEYVTKFRRFFNQYKRGSM